MTLEACYAAMGGDYAGVTGRLHSERLVQKFVLKFLSDSSYKLLESSLAAQDYAEAFRAAHTIKGVCQNLSIDRLGDSVSRLTEALRGGWSDAAAPLIEEVRADYRLTVDAIRAYQAALEA